MSKRIDLQGKRFGRLLVVSREQNSSNGHARWKCVCDCGNEKVVSSDSLRSGRTISCGCYNTERFIKENRQVTHGLRKHKLYGVWRSMKERCVCETHYAYKDYGARGITVCKEWLNDFKVFYDWAMNNGYKEGLTIDRINNNSGYYPENCRWVTMEIQNKNKRNTINKSILQKDKEGNVVNRWNSSTEAARALKINACSIVRCCKGKSKTAYGFYWCYERVE